MINWKTEKRKVDDLIPLKGNPRRITKEQQEQLQKSLEKFNLVEIPAINSDNTIIAGHQRIKILQILGRGKEEIDVRIPSRELTDKEVREYNLRSNKNLGEWDIDLLSEIDDELLKEVGFREDEINRFVKDIDELEDKVDDYNFGDGEYIISIGDFNCAITSKEFEKIKEDIGKFDSFDDYVKERILCSE